MDRTDSLDPDAGFDAGVRSVTMITMMDSIDLQALESRMSMLERHLASIDQNPTITKFMRQHKVGADGIEISEWRDSLSISVDPIEGLGSMRMFIPIPASWNDRERWGTEEFKDVVRMPIAMSRVRTARIGLDGIRIQDTGIRLAMQEMGSILQNEGINPSTCPGIQVTLPLPYRAHMTEEPYAGSLRVDRFSRTPGARKPKAFGMQAEKAILRRHRAFSLSMSEERTFVFSEAKPLGLAAIARDPIETLRDLTGLDLSPKGRHVLSAMRSD